MSLLYVVAVMRLLMLLCLLFLPSTVLSSERHFASLPPPASLFSPESNLYQQQYARKGMTQYGER